MNAGGPVGQLAELNVEELAPRDVQSTVGQALPQLEELVPTLHRMDSHARPGVILGDTLGSVLEEAGAQHTVPGDERPPRGLEPSRIDPLLRVELQVGVTTDTTEHLVVAPADPVRVLHRRQGEGGRLVHRRALHGAEAALAGLSAGPVGKPANRSRHPGGRRRRIIGAGRVDNRPPLGQRRARGEVGETNTGAPPAPSADQTHGANRIQTKTYEIILERHAARSDSHRLSKIIAHHIQR